MIEKNIEKNLNELILDFYLEWLQHGDTIFDEAKEDTK